jgi:hypothetical protein
MYYMFQPIVAIIRYTELLQSPFLLSTIPAYIGPCLHIGSAFYRYIVYLMPLRYSVFNIKY